MKKIITMLTAAALLASSASFSAFAAEAESENLSFDVPDSYDETVDFLNTYGHIYVQDDIIYFCGAFTEFPGVENRFSSEKSTAEFELLSEESYKVENMADGWHHTVMVFQAKSAGTLDFTWTEDTSLMQNAPVGTNTEELYHFTFSVDEQLQVTQTDIFAFTPDGFYEAQAFEQENGSVSIQDGYIVYCQECCLDGGFQVFLETTEPSLDYDVVYEKYLSLEYEEGWPLPGGTNYFVQVLKPKGTRGYLKLNWTQKRDWEGEYSLEPIAKVFEVASTTSDIVDITELTDFATCVRAINFYTFETMPDVTLGVYLHTDCLTPPEPILTWNTSDEPEYYIDYVGLNLFPEDAYIGIVSMPENYNIMVNQVEWSLNGSAYVDILLATDEEIESNYTLGDVNGDSRFTLIDVVLLQKWILGDGSLLNWRAADFNKDAVINGLDLCLMKTAFLEKTVENLPEINRNYPSA